LLEPFFQGPQLFHRLFQCLGVLFLLGQLQKGLTIPKFLLEGFKGLHLIGKKGSLLQDRFAFLWIIPEAVLGEKGFEFFQSVFLARQVKDSSVSG
jgi:hypothetical protein